MMYRLNVNVCVQVAYCELESLTEYFNLTLQVSIKIKVREWILVPK